MTDSAAKRRLPRGLRIILKTLVGLVAAVALLVVALLVIPMTERVSDERLAGAESWMALLDDGTSLADITIPGTHDSATRYSQLAFVTKCQALSVADQLAAGYRYLDIRLGNTADGTLVLKHGFTDCKTGWLGGVLTLQDVLADCYAFLEANPSETILFVVKQEHGDATVAQFQQLLDAVITADADRWLLTDTIPTLGQARGKLVLLRRYEDAAGLGERAGIPILWADQGGNDDVTLDTVCSTSNGYELWVQDRYEYGTDDKWNAFCRGHINTMDKASGVVAVHFLSTKGTFVQGHPYGHARTLNRMLMEDSGEYLTGWIVVDFGDAALAQHIYQANYTAAVA